MRRETQNILLVLLGGALLKLALTGTYLRYVKESLQPWLVATGAIMILLAVVAIVKDLSDGRREEAQAGSHAEAHAESHAASHAESHAQARPEGHVAAPAAVHHDGHEHSSRSPWMLLLPVLAVFLISPPALGADTVNRSDRNAAQQSKAGSGFAPLPDDRVIPLTITEFVTRTAWDDSGSLNDRTVKLTGFVVRKEQNVYLARLTISCCAADAAPVKALMVGQDFSALPTDQWVEATGRVVPGSATKDTAYVPTFTVGEVTPIVPPEDTYEG
ncbi:putative repeat protein (TIGR03943 family) [Saccharothrix tamanrassetensis]|uniref:Putative repeat protein (TIGR03943 family) n=1 Tax=Saccharothrix tamanrassetensis TaxID=1051531 RepID=A0A841CKI6_9PSEU|nr:TIGR03943 family protein [Saccharothrix tamanrassetensis]MBB5957809.1 putative repeat protein (TIGR03943 family) [Saccharothrix tamanrassetensis]